MAVLDRVRSDRLVAAGLIGATITFYSFTLARDFWQMLPMQMLLGFSWASLYVGSLRYVMERSAERATSTGLLGSALNLSQALGPILGGIVAISLGRLGVMYTASAMALVAFIVFVSTAKRVMAGGWSDPAPGG